MSDQILIHGLQYGIYILEAGVCVLLAARGGWRHLKGLFLYVTLLFGLDGVARPAVLNYFGRTSVQYAYFYWLTDVVLALGAFLVICSFFQRACAREEKLWRFVRLLLFLVFVLVGAISALSLTRNYTQLFTSFIIEFSQNLYFTCLVLNTLLYVMIQQLAIDDDELGLLVCGIGVQFAGEAAALALYHVTLGENFARLLFNFLNPACTLGMLLIWVYAIGKTPQAAPARSRAGEDAALAEAIAD
ncbi:MAG: hypothetical protein LAO04_00335 [Acidobacteriia bacterium]|nr:hypothetical protein [Terriglobia bacterium]